MDGSFHQETSVLSGDSYTEFVSDISGNIGDRRFHDSNHNLNDSSLCKKIENLNVSLDRRVTYLKKQIIHNSTKNIKRIQKILNAKSPVMYDANTQYDLNQGNFPYASESTKGNPLKSDRNSVRNIFKMNTEISSRHIQAEENIDQIGPSARSNSYRIDSMMTMSSDDFLSDRLKSTMGSNIEPETKQYQNHGKKSNIPYFEIRLKQTESIYLNVRDKALQNISYHRKTKNSPKNDSKPAWESNTNAPIPICNKTERPIGYHDKNHVEIWLSESFPALKNKIHHDSRFNQSLGSIQSYYGYNTDHSTANNEVIRPSTAPATSSNVSRLRRKAPTVTRRETTPQSHRYNADISLDDLLSPRTKAITGAGISRSADVGKSKWLILLRELHLVGSHVTHADLLELGSLRKPHVSITSIVGYIGLLFRNQCNWKDSKYFVSQNHHQLIYLLKGVDPLSFPQDKLIEMDAYMDNHLLPLLDLNRSINSLNCAVNLLLRWILSFHSLVKLYLFAVESIAIFSPKTKNNVNKLAIKTFQKILDEDFEDDNMDLYKTNPITADRSLNRRLVVKRENRNKIASIDAVVDGSNNLPILSPSKSNQRKNNDSKGMTDRFESGKFDPMGNSNGNIYSDLANSSYDLASPACRSIHSPSQVKKSSELFSSSQNLNELSLNDIEQDKHKRFRWFYIYLKKTLRPSHTLSSIIAKYIIPLTPTEIPESLMQRSNHLALNIKNLKRFQGDNAMSLDEKGISTIRSSIRRKSQTPEQISNAMVLKDCNIAAQNVGLLTTYTSCDNIMSHSSPHIDYDRAIKGSDMGMNYDSTSSNRDARMASSNDNTSKHIDICQTDPTAGLPIDLIQLSSKLCSHINRPIAAAESSLEPCNGNPVESVTHSRRGSHASLSLIPSVKDGKIVYELASNSEDSA